jgi:hypothetical protein
VLESGSSHSQVLVKASLKDSAGYIVFRICWTMDGDEVNEYVSPLDVLHGMSGVPCAIMLWFPPKGNITALSLSDLRTLFLGLCKL